MKETAAVEPSQTTRDTANEISDEITCCEGDKCSCDGSLDSRFLAFKAFEASSDNSIDACLEQLARAICADDDGRIHSGDDEKNHEHCAFNDGADCSTCCEQSDDTCKDGMSSKSFFEPY